MGHIANLLPIAIALRARGHHVYFLVTDCEIAHRGLASHDFRFFPAPVWRRNTGLAAQSTYPEILLGAGFADETGLLGMAHGWRAAICGATRSVAADDMPATASNSGTDWPDIVITDFAPTALLAVRGLPIKTVVIGQGFLVPPAIFPFPVFRSWERVNEAELTAIEALVLKSVNAVLCNLHAPILAYLGELLKVNQTVLLTWPELDHYGARTPTPALSYFGPCVGLSSCVPFSWRRTKGTKLFAYLKFEYNHLAALLTSINYACRTGLLNAHVVLLNASNHQIVQLRHQFNANALTLTNALSDWNTVLASAEVVACHAGPATATTAIQKGIPVLLLPMNAEQFLFSMKVEALNCGLMVAPNARQITFETALAKVCEASYLNAARTFAQKYSTFSSSDNLAAIVRKIDSLLVG